MNAETIGHRKARAFPDSPCRLRSDQRWKAFDADTGKDTARKIREYYIPDFSNWKDHDSLEQAFIKLLDALEKDEKLPSPNPVTGRENDTRSRDTRARRVPIDHVGRVREGSHLAHI